MLSNYSVFPNFLDVLQTFGAKTERSSDEFGVYYQHSSERCFRTISSSFLLFQTISNKAKRFVITLNTSDTDRTITIQALHLYMLLVRLVYGQCTITRVSAACGSCYSLQRILKNVFVKMKDYCLSWMFIDSS